MRPPQMPKHSMKKILGALLIFSVVLYSCKDDGPTFPAGLDGLPKDTGGEHKAHPLNSDASPYGYYLYTPAGYSAAGPKYPLLIFMHGSGESANSQTSASNLDKILANGPPKLIKAKQWSPKYPMVVASLQTHTGEWDAAKVKATTEFLMKTYAIDTTRIYMTGLSLGGIGTWEQLCSYGKGSHVTAALPIAGAVFFIDATRTKRASTVPIWAFHGDADNVVSMTGDVNMYKAINALTPAPAVKMKLTIYPGTAHDSWTKTYNNSGKGSATSSAYDPFDMDIYEWLFQYQKK